MDYDLIRKKFGNDYHANEMTFRMGIDIRFTEYLASRFRGRVTLETCTGGGFSSISLAKYSKTVVSFDIDKNRINDARQNASIAGVSEKITFINDTIFNLDDYEFSLKIDAAFIDPDWAVRGDDHVYRFRNSTTEPPSDFLLNYVSGITQNMTLVQPPFINPAEFDCLPPHELECLYLENRLELYCLHFGSNMSTPGRTVFTV